MVFKEKLYQRALNFNIELDQTQLDQFKMYYDMLIEKNKVMNLTSITKEEEVIEKHFIDSLSSVRIIDFNKVDKVIDIGTGAGFPGIPLKIAFPDIHLTLLDSLNKRICFIDDVIGELHLDKIEAVHGRAEDYARDRDYRASYDLCVSRAVANLSTLCEYCIPFIKTDGIFISYKSKKVFEEIGHIDHCLKLLGSKIIKIDEFSLSDLSENDLSRILIKIKKCKDTPGKYPRKAGVPSRNPL